MSNRRIGSASPRLDGSRPPESGVTSALVAASASGYSCASRAATSRPQRRPRRQDAGFQPTHDFAASRVALLEQISRSRIATPTIASGTNSLRASPSWMPTNPAGATPTTRKCRPLTVMSLPTTPGRSQRPPPQTVTQYRRPDARPEHHPFRSEEPSCGWHEAEHLEVVPDTIIPLMRSGSRPIRARAPRPDTRSTRECRRAGRVAPDTRAAKASLIGARPAWLVREVARRGQPDKLVAPSPGGERKRAALTSVNTAVFAPTPRRA